MIRRSHIPLVLAAAALAACGCGRRAAPPASSPSPPAGRLVPAVVSGFERGAGGWKAVSPDGLPSVEAVSGGGSRGARWLSVSPVGASTLDVRVDMPPQDWTKFGDALRADVRAEGAGKAYARLFLGAPGGKEVSGPETLVGAKWTTLVWPAGGALSRISRLGVRWRLEGKVSRLGLDNVRVGAAAGLNQAYSVASGPYLSRDAAVRAMQGLQTSGINSFPIYEEGWFLNLGTFRTKSAATSEAARFRARGLKVTLLTR